MSSYETCLLCGTEDRDVRVSLVRVEQPDRMVDVGIRAGSRDDVGTHLVRVPERYFATPRCTDRPACLERQYQIDGGERERVSAGAAAIVELEPDEQQPVEADDDEAFL